MDEIEQALPEGALVIAYLDDIYVVCEPKDTALIFRTVEAVLARVCHIDVNLGKLSAWSKEENPCPAGLIDISETAWKSDAEAQCRGIKVLGSPTGCTEFVHRVGAEILDEKAQLLQFLPKLPSLQVAWLLLYYCAVPRVNHLSRTLPPEQVFTTALQHDRAIQDTFQRLFAIPAASAWDEHLHRGPSTWWASQAKLPLRLGGCGLRDSTQISHAAYWASWADCLPGLRARCPIVGNRILLQLSLAAAMGDAIDTAEPTAAIAAERAGRHCDQNGYA